MKKTVALLCVILLLCQILTPVTAFAAGEPYAVQIEIDGAVRSCRALDGSYEGNLFLSLNDLAAAMSGSEKQFRFERVISSTDGEYFNIITGQPATMASGAEAAQPRNGTAVLNLFRNRLLLNGEDRRYYTHNPQNGDLYMSLTDVQLMLDVTILRDSNGLRVLTDMPFLPNVVELRESGYFDTMNGVFLADAETGEVLFQYNPKKALPIASLSKLLSYLILKEAMDAGEIGEQDMVRISERAQELSQSGDGMVPLKAGTEVPIHELVEAMLIASSNEAALALAEHLCGSEEAFVVRMTEKAKELGLASTEVYNCNGLPSYTDGNVPIKRQNRMSAEDLFLLSAEILRKYPEIIDITSMRIGHMPSLNDYWTANSNPLVFNMPGVNGLKTGSTNRAGYCIAATMPVQKGGETHTVVLVLLGMEAAETRGQASEILLRYARSRYAQG